MIPVRSVQDPPVKSTLVKSDLDPIYPKNATGGTTYLQDPTQPLDLAWLYPNLHLLQWCLPSGLKSTKRQNLLRHTCPGKNTFPVAPASPP